jgi:5-deoxy-glucuronate isomerase
MDHVPNSWKRRSPAGPGLHVVASPADSPFRVSHIFRLNLPAGQSHQLAMPGLELTAAIIAGSARLAHAGTTVSLGKCDSFYLPGGDIATLTAAEDAVLYLGAGPCEGFGAFYVRRFDLSLPMGAIHQIHGEPPFQREVFMTLDPDTPASRLIAGFTWGAPGGWTSWPPHQHEKDLEETYFYFDLPADRAVLHLSYTDRFENAVTHPVRSGDLAMAPAGYHPTVAPPGVRSTYFWILVAHSHCSRRYDLAVADPAFATAEVT